MNKTDHTVAENLVKPATKLMTRESRVAMLFPLQNDCWIIVPNKCHAICKSTTKSTHY